MSYNNPNVFAVPNPKGLDLAILKAQTKLGELSYLTKVFGRAWDMSDYHSDKTRRVTTSDGIKPKVFVSSNVNGKDGNYQNVLPNDNLDSYCFFTVQGGEEIEEGKLARRPMSVIFWGNLNKIDQSKQYPFLEDLKEQFYEKLGSIKSLEISGYTDVTEEIWQGFDWSSNKNKNSRYPNMGFRIFFDIYYSEKTC